MISFFYERCFFPDIRYRYMKIRIISYATILVLIIPILVISFSAASPQHGEITLGLIPSGSTSPFHQEIAAGVNRSAHDRNWSVTIRAPDIEENITLQKNAMKDLIAKPVQIISLNTLNGSDLKPEIAAAKDAHIPVIMYNTLTPDDSLNVSEYIGYNQYIGGAEMGSYAARLLAEKKNDALESVQGRVFILRGLPGFHADERTKGFLTGISGSPGIRIVGQKMAGWDRETAREIADNALANDSRIDIFFADSDEMAIGASIAARHRGKTINSDIYCLGIDGNAPTLEMIHNGTMTATLGVFPDKMGNIIVDQAAKILNNEQVPRYLETPTVVVDTRNIDAYLNGSLWTDAVESIPEKANA